MSQHDYNIANADGATFRADLNDVLLAIVSQNYGAAQPGTMFANMTWYDGTSMTKKRRNAANSGWLMEGTLDETFVVARSSNTMLAAKDRGKSFVFTGSFTQTFDAVATLADGWAVSYRNAGTGYITLDPSGAETIDGSTTLVIGPGCAGVIACNGSALYHVSRAGGRMTMCWPAKAMKARLTNGASLATARELTTNKGVLETMNFADGTKLYAQFDVRMPKGWDGGAIRFAPVWTAQSGTGSVVWGLSGRAFNDDDALDAAQGTPAEVTDAFITANDLHAAAISGDITIAGSPAGGSWVKFEVYRDPANGSDNFNATAELIGVDIYYNVKSPDDSQ